MADIPSSPELQRWLDSMMASYGSQVDRASKNNWQSTMSPFFANDAYLGSAYLDANAKYTQHYADLKAEYAKELEAQKAMLEYQGQQQRQQAWQSQQAARENALMAGSMQGQMATAAAMGSPFWGHDTGSGNVGQPGYWLNGQWQVGQKPWWLTNAPNGQINSNAWNGAQNAVRPGAQQASHVYNSNSPSAAYANSGLSMPINESAY